MLSAADNTMLTRTGAGTPMGNLFRQYWTPVLLSRELPAPDCPPVRVRVHGEDLLAFRDTEGRVGLIDPFCSHRGANLFFGRNEAGGIRCVYHGWKFDVLGNCLEAPTLEAEVLVKLRDRARIKAYPACDWGDLVWAYLGPRALPPPLPGLEFALLPASHRHVSKKLQECNWAQVVEGAIDTAHFSFLHQPVVTSQADLELKTAQAIKGFSRSTMSSDHLRWMRDDPRPRYHVAAHPAGLVLAGARHAEPGELYWRIAQFLLPSIALTPSAARGQNYHAQHFVPIDDESCWIYLFTWNPERSITDAERESYRQGGAVYAVVDEQYRPVRNRANDYLIDRRLQKTENFTGILGVSEQDAAVQDSQGRIADRSRELLGPTDIGVVQFRRLMLEQATALRAGTEPAVVDQPDAYAVRAGGIVAEASLPFEAVMQRRFGDVLGRIVSKEASAA